MEKVKRELIFEEMLVRKGTIDGELRQRVDEKRSEYRGLARTQSMLSRAELDALRKEEKNIE